MTGQYELLIAGAGPVGCVIAERAASVLGWRVLIVERRDHIAGLCYDGPHASGVIVHRYGPHYFCTSNAALVACLSRFTEWINADYFSVTGLLASCLGAAVLLTVVNFYQDPTVGPA